MMYTYIPALIQLYQEVSTVDIAALIRENGIAVVMLLWFMFRLEKKLDELADVLILVKAALIAQKGKSDDGSS